MSVIFPGNYVADLNAYREQGVYATPGVEFYQVRGVALVTANLTGGGTLSPQILSPDLRQDDKPRLDKAFKVPAGSTVYRTAINVVNLKASGTDTVRVDGLTTTTNTEATLTASSGVFPAAGATTTFDFGTTKSVESSEITISAPYSGALTIDNTDEQAYVIVEVCYCKDAAAPVADDCNVPYKVEAGSGT
tara:strand:- start:1667 stop:2239 length:573 start_codon:yes stop_codon:yes gene_type:complete